MARAKTVPTQRGDVLILSTATSYQTHAVGAVVKDGQQGFSVRSAVKYDKELVTAVTAAKALVRPGRRIFLVDLDRDDWIAINA